MNQNLHKSFGQHSYSKHHIQNSYYSKNRDQSTFDSFIRIDNSQNQKNMFNNNVGQYTKSNIQKYSDPFKFINKKLVEKNIQSIQNIDLNEEIDYENNIFLENQITVNFHLVFSTKNGDEYISLPKMNKQRTFQFDNSTPIYMIEEFVEQNYLPQKTEIITIAELNKYDQNAEDFKLHTLKDLTDQNTLQLVVHCNIDTSQDLANVSLLPKFSVNQYTEPKIHVISRSSEQKLQNFKDLRIYNKYAVLEFLRPVNILKANFNTQMQFKRGSVWIKESLLQHLFCFYDQIPPQSIKLQLLQIPSINLERVSKNKTMAVRNFEDLFNLEVNSLLIDKQQNTLTVIF